jgi:acyl-CoA reductase-like NAD-dependent aldehyde dehydrogenase
VFTSDVQTGVSVARQVRTGTFSVNTFAVDLGSPFGGVKESGIGREHGPTAVEEFLVSKTISLPPSGPSPSEVATKAVVGVGPGISK